MLCRTSPFLEFETPNLTSASYGNLKVILRTYLFEHNHSGLTAHIGSYICLVYLFPQETSQSFHRSHEKASACFSDHHSSAEVKPVMQNMTTLHVSKRGVWRTVYGAKAK